MMMKPIQLAFQFPLPLTYQASEKKESASVTDATNRYPILAAKRANIAAGHASKKHTVTLKK